MKKRQKYFLPPFLLLNLFVLLEIRHLVPQHGLGEEDVCGQRTAIARGLANAPRLLLADEPTGNLDQVNGAAIMDLIFALRDRHGATLVLVTHAPELAARCDRVVRLVDGQIAGAAA